MTTQHIEVNKVDAIWKVNGTGLEIEVLEDKFLFYIATDEGRVYCVDNSVNTIDNPAANVINHYYNRYYRPVLFFQISPFLMIYSLLFMIFIFLWSKSRSKRIFISPNLKKSSYTCGTFSPSRPRSIIFM